MQADLKLEAVEVHDVEHDHVVLTLGIGSIFDMLLGRFAHFPHMLGAATVDDVVAA